jgi:hypothetical protein
VSTLLAERIELGPRLSSEKGLVMRGTSATRVTLMSKAKSDVSA